MMRSVLATAVVLSLAVPAFAQDAPDMSKMTCAQMLEQQGGRLAKNGQTLQKAGAASIERGKWMKKSKAFRADGAGQMRGGQGMIAMGKKMESHGKWMMKQAKSGKHGHTMADAMAEMSKAPAEVRTKWAASAKEIAAGFTEWGNDMIKNSAMMEAMMSKLGEAKEAAKEEKKE